MVLKHSLFEITFLMITFDAFGIRKMLQIQRLVDSWLRQQLSLQDKSVDQKFWTE